MKRHDDTGFDTSYEWKAVALLSVGFGLVNLDRFVIYPLFPVIMADLHLNYQHLGMISAVLAICWGGAAILFGRYSDLVGRRPVLLASVIAFSALAGLTGLATGIVTLLLIRSVMGIAEGAYVPTSIAATAEASKFSRIGMNLGIQQLSSPLIGHALAPILVTQLLPLVPSWRWVFVIVSLPGFLLAWIMFSTLRESHAGTVPGNAPPATDRSAWLEVIRYRGVILNTLLMLCLLCCIVVLASMMPSYLTDHLHLKLDQMGFVMSSIGVGGVVGMFALPSLSDRIGRRPVLWGAMIIQLPALLLLRSAGPDQWLLFSLLCVVAIANTGAIVITNGPMTSECVPRRLRSTATGVVIGVAEIIGGGIAPGVAGVIAHRYGIASILNFAIVGISLGLVVVAYMSLSRRSAPEEESRAPVSTDS
jgi:MFS family permease